MNMRFMWVLKSVVIGLVVLAVAYYLFSLASSISASEQKMLDRLAHYNDSTFEFWPGYYDATWLAFIGTLVACFAGGMTAASLSRGEMPSEYGWAVTSVIVVIFVILAVDANLYLSWSNSIQMAQAGMALGRPIEPTPFFVVFLIMFVFDGLCFLASVAGGFIAGDSWRNIS